MRFVSEEFYQPSVGFIFFPEHLSSSAVEAVKRTGAKMIFDLTGLDSVKRIGEPLQDVSALDTVELKLSAEALLRDPALPGLLRIMNVTTVWAEIHEPLVPDFDAVQEKISELSDCLTIIPILGSIPLIRKIIQAHPEIRVIALKGNEASGFVGSETLFILYAAVRQMIQDLDEAPRLAIWGGVALAEAAAAFLATGSKRILFESVHWFTDLFTASEHFRKKAGNLRPNHMDVAGLSLGTPCRLFDKGNSRAVKEIKDFADSLCGPEITDAKRREFCERIRNQWRPPHLGSFGRDELIPLGIEAAFASSFVDRYGAGTETAIAGFKKEIDLHLADAPKAASAFADSRMARIMGVRYPFIQGAMTWIADNPLLRLLGNCMRNWLKDLLAQVCPLRAPSRVTL